MIKSYPFEEWKEIKFEFNTKLKYRVSNFGRVMSYTEKPEDGNLRNGTDANGYRSHGFQYRDENFKLVTRHMMVHRLVAEYFLKKESEDQNIVIHLDYNKVNNRVSNIQWANKEQYRAHNKKNPKVIESQKKVVQFNIQRDGHKLTSTQVIRIKKRLADPNRKTRMKMLAKEFGISEMQLYRIKTGENWGHIKID